MYVLGPARQRALGASGLALEHHRSYNSSWHEPQKYTATVADIDLDLLRSCADSIEQSWELLGEQYLAQTGDVEGTEVKNGTIVLKCWQGKWWAAPSCRQNVSECAAIVTGGTGWGMTEMPQQAFFWNMPLAFATAAQAPVSQYYLLNKQLQSLLYWWAPDTMFALDDPNMIIFPKNNAREYAAGLYRTAKDRAILSNWVAGGLGRSDIRDALQLVRKLHFTDEAMRGLLVDFSTFNGSAADTACAWVRMHRHVWKDWLPNATLPCLHWACGA
ncbi:RPS6 [Symbiodinium sp. CCMP2592]|nr:RPS6 [Symbiodinium sp. CCMP2592]